MFVGAQVVATVHQLDDFVRRAEPDQRFVYCEAPDLIRGETSDRVAELRRQGLVIPAQERRAGGGFRFLVVRTRYKPRPKADPVREALGDSATARILRRLERAAEAGERCPSDAELAEDCGLNTRNEAQWRVRKLAALGVIESVVATERNVRTRVVTIVHSGKRTAPPPLWAAREKAGEDALLTDLRRGGGL
jgi:hypothetical protein